MLLSLVYVGMDIAKATLDLHALTTPRPQSRQFANDRTGQRALGRWLQALTELRQHLRIQPIGLGQTTLRPCKVTSLARVDDTDGEGRLL